MAEDNVGTIASALLNLNGEEDEPDYLQVLEALKPMLWPKQFVRICEAMEVCPVHIRDEHICADDEDDCPAGRHESSAEDDVPGSLLPPPPDGYTQGDAATELALHAPPELYLELRDASDRAGEGTEYVEAHLDWSAQLRQREHLTWAQALYAGSIFFYG